MRNNLGLPKASPIAATLAEAGEWPLQFFMLHRALGHIDRLHRAPDGKAMLSRLRNQPPSHTRAICKLYEEVVMERPRPVSTPPPHKPPPEARTSFYGTSKHHSPAVALQQAAACKIEEALQGKLLPFTDGSVLLDGSAAAARTIAATGTSRQCRIPFKAS